MQSETAQFDGKEQYGKIEQFYMVNSHKLVYKSSY